MDKVLFIGGPGNISSSCAEDLVAGGCDLAILKRTPNVDPKFEDTVKLYQGDRNRPADLKAAIEDFQPETVVDFVCFDPDQAEQLSRLVTDSLRHYVFVSTIDVYGYPLSHIPMRENDPRTQTQSPYGAKKRSCEELLLQRQREAGLPLTIVRPTYSFGVQSGMLSFFTWGGMKFQVPRIRAGLPVLVPGDGNTIIHASCAYNTGRMIAQVVKDPDTTVGKSYTCGRDGSITFDEYMQLVGGVVGKEPKLVHVPTDVLLSIGSQEIEESFLPALTRFNMCFSVETFKKDFPDFKWTMSLEEGVRQYVDWYDEHDLFPNPGEEIYEDQIIRAWQKTVEHFQM